MSILVNLSFNIVALCIPNIDLRGPTMTKDILSPWTPDPFDPFGSGIIQKTLQFSLVKARFYASFYLPFFKMHYCAKQMNIKLPEAN